MPLTREQVEKVSLLARLRLSEDELETMTAQLGAIVGYIEQLAELDTDSIQPMAHAVELHNVFRADEVRPSVDRAEMLAGTRRPTANATLCPPSWATESSAPGARERFMSLIEQSAKQSLSQLAAGEVSAVELTEAYLAEIATHDAKVGAFLRVDADGARAKAREVDERRSRGESLGPLAGLPVAVKDILCSRGEVVTCASRILEGFKAPYDSTVIAKLKAADAVLIGRTNLDEFAMGGSTENSAFHVTHNPWDLSCFAGGSSGGSAACVAARMAPLAIGTDTGGSIRQPAGLCGITGLKPTYGHVSRYGVVAFASSLDQVGPLGRTAEDVALLLETIAGHDPLDSTSVCTRAAL